MPGTVRVRFAPSPTGEPHVGNIRTAIFNWLFARHSGGSFIIRVEDTDQSRKVEGAVEDILDSLRWLGIGWDEGPDIGGEYGPYVQSQRLDRYQAAAARLVDEGRAYRCYCTPARLSEIREEQERLKRQLGYDRLCRHLTSEERRVREKGGSPHVVRFAMPLDGVTAVSDMLRGRVTYENSLIDDFVILKSDGFPTYHLANVVDDHAMEISHVLRAEEWLPSAPRHLLLYDALGLDAPQLAHLPIILAPDRSKLSKRHGATSVLDYREEGYVPAAMVNFLSLLGWSLDDKTEILAVQELIDAFDLMRVSKVGAVFSIDKLRWMNGHYIRQMSPDALADSLTDYWQRYPPEGIPQQPDREQVRKIAPLVHERLKTLKDAAPLVSFLFGPGLDYPPADLVPKGMDAEGTRAGLEAALEALKALPSFDAEAIEGALRPLAADLGLKPRQLFGTLRTATTGLQVSPPLFETMEVLGRERTLAALRDAIDKL